MFSAAKTLFVRDELLTSAVAYRAYVPAGTFREASVATSGVTVAVLNLVAYAGGIAPAWSDLGAAASARPTPTETAAAPPRAAAAAPPRRTSRRLESVS